MQSLHIFYIIDKMKTRILLLLAAFFGFIGLFGWVSPVSAQAMDKVGMHVLHPQEFTKVAQLYGEVRNDKDDPIYVTIPFSLSDIDKLSQWQAAFNIAKSENIVPLVRLSTKMNAEAGGWERPSRHDIVQLSQALNHLKWPQSKRHVIIFNEPNHAGEWGGEIDAESFAEMTEFTLDWLKTEDKNYVLLPAALDLAAANTATTQEAFGYWRRALAHRPEIINKIDAWNSHSYPNPGFMSSPTRNGQNSMRGYQTELAFIKNYTDKQLPVFITETGWLDRFSAYRLQANYDYALKNIWSDERVVAVTPFVLAGAPGPFAEFSFVNENGEPTRHWSALADSLRKYQQQLITKR